MRRRALFASLSLSLISAFPACSGSTARPDGGPVGPEGGVLRFDAAMLIPTDGGVDAYARDASPPRDTGGLRDGGGSCMGVARPCDLVSACSLQEGCYEAGDCRGSATSCYSLFYSFECYDQDGCYWSSSSDYCSGSARSCSGFYSSLSCADQQGCYWDPGCDGVETPCSLMRTATECVSQLGCYWL